MVSELGVVVVHGIGIEQPDFADPFIAEMQERLHALGIAAGTVHWEPAYWADLLNDRERQLWNTLARGHHLDWVTVRKFFLNFFADAIAYQRASGQQPDMYHRIHQRIHDHLVQLRTALGQQDAPLVIVAHSLGSVIMSNYIWDEQIGQGLGTTPFARMETLAGFITFGSPIPLFTLALDDVISITFPPPTLPTSLRGHAQWLNFFDADDVIGYPLKPLSPSYDQAVRADLEINVGNLLTAWNPLVHTAYWTDNDFTKPVAQLVRDLVVAQQVGT
jgi:hypothetical protein